jgi:DUF1009 family protein
MRTALILGNGEYAQYLLRLRRSGDACTSICVLPRDESNIDGCDHYLENGDLLQRLDAIKTILANEHADSLVFGGNFRLLETGATGAIVGDVRRILLLEIRQHLSRQNIRAIRASELLPELDPGQGFLAMGAHSIPEEHLKKVVSLSLPKARMVPFGSRHSIVYDDGNLADEDLHSTDDMLKDLAGGDQKQAYPRCLVRIVAENERSPIDAPVISEKTVEGAAKAGVDAIVIGSHNCIVFTRETVKRSAEARGITVYAATIVPDGAAPGAGHELKS